METVSRAGPEPPPGLGWGLSQLQSRAVALVLHPYKVRPNSFRLLVALSGLIQVASHNAV